MTLTNETIKLWRNNAEITAGETAEDDPEHIAAKAILALTSELLANREAQTAACDIERIKRHALPAGECPRQSQVVLLSSLKRLLTAPPAPAIPDIGSSVVNDAAWKLHDTLTKYGPLNGHQFNHLKSCLYEALKIVMAAPPAQAAPERN
ncbi:TPA: hypothetical protein ACX37K_004438 [Serratia marcescens]